MNTVSIENFSPELAYKYCLPSKGDKELVEHEWKSFKRTIHFDGSTGDRAYRYKWWFRVKACMKCRHIEVLDLKRD